MVTEETAQKIISRYCPAWAGRPVSSVGQGWDNAIFRLGSDVAARFPHRDQAVQCLRNEHYALPRLRPLLSGLEQVEVPELLHQGQPIPEFDRPWSVQTWLDGRPLFNQLPVSSALVTPIADFFVALHQTTDEQLTNPYRGGPLSDRTTITLNYLDAVTSLVDVKRVRRRWMERLETPPSSQTVWLHGDLHPENIVTSPTSIGIIDWGDVCSGDVATDLSLAWMIFSPSDRRRLRRYLANYGYTTYDWQRAQAWAISLGLAHLSGAKTANHRTWATEVINAALDDGL